MLIEDLNGLTSYPHLFLISNAQLPIENRVPYFCFPYQVDIWKIYQINRGVGRCPLVCLILVWIWSSSLFYSKQHLLKLNHSLDLEPTINDNCNQFMYRIMWSCIWNFLLTLDLISRATWGLFWTENILLNYFFLLY